MTLRFKTMGVTALVLLILFASLYLITQSIVLDGFARLEEMETTEDVDRVVNIMDADLNALRLSTTDWATWDDTYQFMQDTNQDYIQSNLTDDALAILKINVMLFTDNAGRVVYSKGFDLNAHAERPIAEDLLAQFTPASPLSSSPDNLTPVAGIIALSDGVLQFASQPILTSQKQGPAVGRLLFGRYIDDQAVQTLSQAALIPLQIYSLAAASLPDDVQLARQHLASSQATYTRPLNREMVAGYRLINDMNGDPLLLLRITIPRAIYLEGQNSLIYLIGALVGAGILCCTVLLWVLSKLILSRLERTNNALETIRQKKDQSMRVPIEGHDEIAALAHGFNETLDALDQSQASLHRNQELLQQVVTSAPLILFALNAEGKVTLVEGKGLRTLGVNPLTVLGKSLLEVDGPLAAFKGSMNTVLAEDTMDSSIQVGSRVFNTHYSPQRSAKGEIHGVIGVAVDITEQHRAQAKLMETEITRLQLEKEREVLNVKQYFISRLSHEFRTPLAIIQASKDMLSSYFDQLTPEKREEKLDKIEEQIHLIVEMLDQVLLLSKANLGKMRFEPAQLNLVRFAQELFEQMQTVDQKKHKFSFAVTGQLDDVKMDEKLLRQILSNLFSNAIKYSPQGGMISFELNRSGDDVMMKISDQGIGIPLKDLSHLFEPFYRSDNTQGIKGTGLGLAIVRESVEMHGGTIECESVQGKGTTFTLRLPVGLATPDPVPA